MIKALVQFKSYESRSWSPTPISLLRLFSLTLKQYRGIWLAQLGEPCFLLKILNVPLGQLCNQRHDDLGSSGLHHWDLVLLVPQSHSREGHTGLFLVHLVQGPVPWALDSLAFKDAACDWWKRSHGIGFLRTSIMPDWGKNILPRSPLGSRASPISSLKAIGRLESQCFN